MFSRAFSSHKFCLTRNAVKVLSSLKLPVFKGISDFKAGLFFFKPSQLQKAHLTNLNM